MVEKKKKRFQGSLEYLIIIAAVLAIAAIVVLFLTGAFSGATSAGDISKCKSVASQCKTELATSAGALCNYCKTECPAEFVELCKEGAPEMIYEGAMGTGGAGFNVQFMNQESLTLKNVNLRIIRMELEGPSGTQVISSDVRDIKLGENDVIRAVSRKIPAGKYTKLRIYFDENAVSRGFENEAYATRVMTPVVEIDFDQQVKNRDVLNVFAQVYLPSALEMKESGLEIRMDNSLSSAYMVQRDVLKEGFESEMPWFQAGPARPLKSEERQLLGAQVGSGIHEFGIIIGPGGGKEVAGIIIGPGGGKEVAGIIIGPGSGEMFN